MTEYFDSAKNKFLPIPQTNYYVTSYDPFMSDWPGSIAEDKQNICVVPCENKKIAKSVVSYMVSRGDQKDIRISQKMPKNKPYFIYSLLLDWLSMAEERIKILSDQKKRSKIKLKY